MGKERYNSKSKQRIPKKKKNLHLEVLHGCPVKIFYLADSFLRAKAPIK